MSNTTHHQAIRFWAPVGLGAAVAGTLTAALLTTVLAGPDATRDGAPVAPVSTTDREPPSCFQGNHRWRVDLYGEPPCITLDP